jgi:chemosensory pili system protein ChpA (sensor histidine kinase/response regulator)
MNHASHRDVDRPARAEAAVPADAEVAPAQLRRLFLDESSAHVAAVETALASLRSAEGAPGLQAAAEEMLRHLHTLKGAAGTVGLDGIGDAAHRLEELCADVHAHRLEPTFGVLELLDESLATLAALLDGARVSPGEPASHDSHGDGSDGAPPPAAPHLKAAHLEAMQDGVGDLVILRARVERRLREFEGTVRDLQRTRRGLHEMVHQLSDSGPATAQVPPEPRRPPRRAGDPPGPGRDHADSLGQRLAELESQLGDAGTQLERATRALGGEVETLRRLTAQIDEELRRARKVPLSWAFQRLPHALRELELHTGRMAQLTLAGGELEVDQALAEQIAEALLHLLRNALAHGLETPEERRAAGKDPRGRIEVSARSEGDRLIVTFADDGRGLDRAEIRRALVRTGRLSAEDAPSETQMMAAIFEAGFSSRPIADQLAGRGLGLHIVKGAALRTGGDVTVEDAPGQGTRFVFSAPQPAAITLAVLFKVGAEVYAIPAAHVERAEMHATSSEGLHLDLHALFGHEPGPRRPATALWVRHGQLGFRLGCDKIIGPRTIVVRPLGPVLTGLPLYAGVTVSGSGKAQLVLDVATLAQLALHPAEGGTHAALGATCASPRATPRVLVVDDSRLQREATARVLYAGGLSAVTAEDGLEAWELLGERHFDALITDLEMPRLDGFDLIARVRSEAALKDLPVIVVSSRTTRAPRGRALAIGADAILPKNPHRKLLLDTLTALLAHRAEPPR